VKPLTYPLVSLANDIDITDWCAFVGPIAWRNPRGAVELTVAFMPENSRPFRLAVRTQAAHVHGKDRYIALNFRTDIQPGADPYLMARGYVRLITTLMGVDKKEVSYVGFKPP